MSTTGPALSDPKILDDLARRLANGVPKGIQLLQTDLERNLRAGLETALMRLGLVTRDELEVQAGVLARTREKLAALERRIAELEERTETPHRPPG